MELLRGGIVALAFVIILFFDNGFARTGSKANDAVKLSRVKSLTFYAGKLTTSRRVDPIPQLHCTGGSAQGLYEPETIRCQNSGSSYSEGDIQWTCQASLPPEFKLGSTEVICEGYDNSDDEYILKGSCGLEYRLILTESGKEKFGRSWFKAADQSAKATRKASSRDRDFSPTIFWILFLAVACWMIYAAFCRNGEGIRSNQTRRLGPQAGRGGPSNGHDDDNDDPPPPYDPRSPRPSYPPPKQSPSSSTYYGGGSQSNYDRSQGWRPGFWTGMAAGAAAGRLFGGGSNRPNSRETPRRSGWSFGSTDDYGEGSSTGRRRPSPYNSGSGARGMGSSSPSFSSQRYTSTGFGGTRKR